MQNLIHRYFQDIISWMWLLHFGRMLEMMALGILKNTIKHFMQVFNTVGWAKDASTLGYLLDEGKKIIITIVYKLLPKYIERIIKEEQHH